MSVLKKDKEFAILRGHPWVYREALKEFPENPKPGEEVILCSHKKIPIGRGFFDPDSPIFVRLIDGNPEEPLSKNIETRLKGAFSLRKALFQNQKTNAYRLINGEGDGLGGLVIDRFNEALSLQVYSLGWEPYLPLIVNVLTRQYPEIKWIYRRNQVRRTQSQGSEGELLFGKGMPESIAFFEHGLRFQANLVQGQKTGFFLDQRENRRLIGSLSHGKKVANVCGYTGAFTIYAAAGNARETLTIDTAGPALRETENHLKMNNIPPGKNLILQADMFAFLESPKAKEFDLIILDPPSMAKSRKDVPKALNAYRRLNTLAFRAIPSGGMIFTASCSSQVSRDDFLDTVQKASLEARRTSRLLAETHHPPDHPIKFGHPEGRYLHGLLLEVS